MLAKNKQLSSTAQAKVKKSKADLFESMRGPQGLQGDAGLNGVDGAKGLDGKAGMNGDTIVGDTGARGPAGPQGERGLRGESIKGDQGEAGQDGRGIQRVAIHGTDLIITYTTGDKVNLGRVVGQMGQRGATGKTGSFIGIGSDPITFTDITSDTILDATTKHLKVDTSAGDVTLTLPLSAVGSIEYQVWKTTSDTNKVIMARSGADTISGDVCFEWGNQWALYSFIPDKESLWLVK